MSRCFPFPPPGYENKFRPLDVNFLIKEKEKEKRRKKEKKDKEKKEKRHKDKEKSEGKHRDKKDRKHKHKDKKEKNQDTEKTKTSEQKVAELPKHHNGEKLGPICIPGDGHLDSKLLVEELGRRVQYDGGAASSQMFQETTVSDKRSLQVPGKVGACSVGILAEAHEVNRDRNKNSDGRSLGVNASDFENGAELVQGNPSTVEAVVCPVVKISDMQKEGKEKKKHKSSDRKRDRHKDRDSKKKSKSKDKRGEKEKEKDGKKEKKEKVKEDKSKEKTGLQESIINREVSDARSSNVGKIRESQSNGFLHGNGTSSLARPPSFSPQVMQNGNEHFAPQNAIQFASDREDLAQDNSKVSLSRAVLENGTKLGHSKMNSISDREGLINNDKVNGSISSLPTVVGSKRKLDERKAVTSAGNIGHGLSKNYKVNGEVSSSPPVAENGRESETSHLSARITAQGTGYSISKVENKESQINCVIRVEQPNLSSRPVSAPVRVKENVETLKKPKPKPPHPDSKYLDQILTIPTVEFPAFQDQEWLFSTEDLMAKKARSSPIQGEQTKQVWAEALWVESADVTALPYVIPY